MITITKKLEFDAGHRVYGHESKCANLHGHRYVAEIQVTAPELDSLGRVIDFSVIKAKVGGWIDDNWDHKMILWKLDVLISGAPWQHLPASEMRGVYVMEDMPTAENMARGLKIIASRLLEDAGITVVSVRLYETPTSFAHVT